MHYKQPTEHERYQIDAMNKAGHSVIKLRLLLETAGFYVPIVTF